VRIEWLPEARFNRQSQLAYIGEHNPRAAMAMGDALKAAVARLADFPESAPRGKVPGTRELVVTGTPFIIVYRIENSAILIVRLLHGAQRWPPLPPR